MDPKLSADKDTIPENFSSVMRDFTADLKTTFPEYASMWWVYGENTTEDGWKDLYTYSLKVYPERFFDILYQNEDIFKKDGKANVDFLPRVDFKKLYFCEGVSKQTQETIWKYLQLILFMVVENVKDKSEFGKTMNLFEGVDEEELQDKMEKAMSSLGDFFKNVDKKEPDGDSSPSDEFLNQIFEDFESSSSSSSSSKKPDSPPDSPPEMPNPEDIHNHIKNLFGGKLGSLAQELVEELTGDLEDTLGINPGDFDSSTSNPTDLLKKLMRHPDKLMKLVKKIQDKFQDKMKTGELSQDEIMREAGDMLRKMKEMGGNSKQMNEMFQNLAKTMGGGSMGKNVKVDTNRLDRMVKSQNIRDRIRANLEKKKQNNDFTLEANATTPNTFVYRPIDGEKAEKTVLSETGETKSKKKKKSKKKA